MSDADTRDAIALKQDREKRIRARNARKRDEYRIMTKAELQRFLQETAR